MSLDPGADRSAFDVLIVGAGPVGASLALALDGSGLRVGLVEARPLGDPGQPSYDDKALALSHGSVRILEGLGVWSNLASEATPIRSVHVSQQGRLGRTLLSAEEARVPSLGQVVPARALGAALNGALENANDLTLLCPAAVERINAGPGEVRVVVREESGEREIAARLVAGADGSRSRVAELLAIGRTEKDYEQVALAANVSPGEPHEGRAYERFTPRGPLALLPLAGQRMGMVWVGSPGFIEDLAALDDAALLSRLQNAFGDRLGRFRKIGARKTYPLKGSRAETVVGPRSVLLGNAAQTLHPVAAQGFNLGLRDVATFAEMVSEARREGLDPGGGEVVRRYARARAGDTRRTRLMTEGLLNLFDPDAAGVAHARGLGLMAFDLMPRAKRAFARKAMGMGGRLSRLARGLPARSDDQ